MLNYTSSRSTKPKPSPPKSVKKKLGKAPKRGRGGQRGNSNARKHGMYSAHNPSPEARTLRQIKLTQPYTISDLKALNGDIKQMGKIMVFGLQLMVSKAPRVRRLGHTILNRALKKFNALVGQKSAILLAYFRIKNLAHDAYILVQAEFIDLRIPENIIFVPPGFENLRTNLSRGGPILTDHQWLLIAGTFLALRDDLDAFRKYKRHKPHPQPRLLMEGILLKLAYEIGWKDVPVLMQKLHPGTNIFPVRVVQQLYRQLFNSVCMRAIYNQLGWHLRVYGDTDLEDLATQGVFYIEKNRLHLSDGQKLTWQKFTALLLLQRALHNERVLSRESALERRRQGIYLCLPSLPGTRSHRDGVPDQGLPIRSENKEMFQPLERSTAWKKWQKIAKQNKV